MKVTNKDIIELKVYNRKTRERIQCFSIVFSQSLCNYALSLASEDHIFDWDQIYIVIDFKNKEKLQYEARYEVMFCKGKNPVFSIRNMRLKKRGYSPYISKSKL